MASEWVPIAERKPDTQGVKLVFAETADEASPFIVTAFWDENGWMGVVPTWGRRVSHWMPLPAPPALEASR